MLPFWLLLLGCNRDYAIALPNDYFLARTSPGQLGVVGPTNRIVTPTSIRGVEVAMVGDVVLGRVDGGMLFIVDTRSHQSWPQLSELQYREQLQRLGIPHEAPLRPVHRQTRFLAPPRHE